METQLPSTDKSADIQTQIDALQAEHQRHDKRLHELDALVWRSPEEEVERKNCQKLKLAAKDQIYGLSKQLKD